MGDICRRSFFGSGHSKQKTRAGGKQTDLWNPERFFPPGYEYEWERKSAVLLLGTGVGLSLLFFRRLHQAAEVLYEYTDRMRVLRKDAVAVSFGQLVANHWGLYVPLLLFLTAMMIYHYIYYYRETKSIYLMRRLPRRGAVLKSCVMGPLSGLGMAAVILALLYLLYYGCYLLVIPGECLP